MSDSIKKTHSVAHGRVNLIGEHTDYNGGWVLPSLIGQKTRVSILHIPGSNVRVTSSKDPKLGYPRTFSFTLGAEKKRGTWEDYIQGLTATLRTEGIDISGFELEIESSVPEGSGLSSSAALEIAILRSIREAFGLSLSDTVLAKIAQKSENEFVGARVGIMDQMACSLASMGQALFLDTHTLNFERIELPLDQMDLVVINSGISHRNTGGGYNERREQCEEACRILGIRQLRELTIHDLARLERLPDLLKKRARHVITENNRVFHAVTAIKSGDTERLGVLFQESHQSMRDDFEVSLPEIDQLVDLCMKHPSVFGARLTGGGFGGSIVALTKKNHKDEVIGSVVPRYAEITLNEASVIA